MVYANDGKKGRGAGREKGEQLGSERRHQSAHLGPYGNGRVTCGSRAVWAVCAET